MIKTMKVWNFGPFKGEHTFNFAAGANRFEGPNESGKSTLIDVAAFVFTGKDASGGDVKPERIAKGEDYLRAEILTPKGTLIGRSLTGKNSEARYLQLQGELQPSVIDTEEAFRTKLKLPAPKLLLSILAPRYALWVLGEGNAAQLRDLLSENIKGAGSMMAELISALKAQGYASDHAGFTDNPKEAEGLRKGIKKTMDETQARLAVAKEQLAALEAELAASGSSTTGEPSKAPSEDELAKARGKVVQIQTELEAKLGERFTAPIIEKVKSAARKAIMWQDFMDALKKDMKCMCCRRLLTDKTEWAGFQKQALDSQQTLAGYRKQMEDEEGAFNRNRELQIKTLKGELMRAQTSLTLLEARSMGAGGNIDALMGEKRKRMEELKSQIDLHTHSVEKTLKEQLDFQEALVQAHRIAPAKVAQARIDALGVVPDAKIRFLNEPARGEPFVKLEYKGLDASLASDGAAIALDLHFRMALRTATNYGWLPVFVDRVESVSTERLPEPNGQSFFFRHEQAATKIQPSSNGRSKEEIVRDVEIAGLKAQIESWLAIEEKDANGPTEVSIEIRKQVEAAIKDKNVEVLKDRLRFLQGK